MPTRASGRYALSQVAAVGRFDLDVLVEDGRLEAEDVLTDAADGFEERRPGLGVSGGELVGRHAERVGRELYLVELIRVVEDRLEPPGADVGTYPLDHLDR